MSKVHIILMASGRSKRFGANKLLQQLKGKYVIEHTLDLLLALRECAGKELGEILLVTDYDQIKELGKVRGIECIHNPWADEGIAGSIRKGVACISSCKEGDGICFMVADQPALSVESMQLLIEGFQSNAHNIVYLGTQNKGGNPVIYPSYLKEELLTLKGEEGGKTLLRRYPHLGKIVYIEDEIELMDVDDWASLEQLKNEFL